MEQLLPSSVIPFLEESEALQEVKREDPNNDSIQDVSEKSFFRDNSHDGQCISQRHHAYARDISGESFHHDFPDRSSSGPHSDKKKTISRKISRNNSREVPMNNNSIHYLFTTTSETLQQESVFKKDDPESGNHKEKEDSHYYYDKLQPDKSPASATSPRKYVRSGIKRVKPEDNSEGIKLDSLIESGSDEETKKTKQERNRVCARECRKRRKQYLESIEGQVQQLREELVACRRELQRYKAREQEGLLSQFSNNDSLLSESIKELEKEAQGNEGADTIARNYLQRYIVYSYATKPIYRDSAKRINRVVRRLLIFSVPKSFSYFFLTSINISCGARRRSKVYSVFLVREISAES